jgi:hypothetical protein
MGRCCVVLSVFSQMRDTACTYKWCVRTYTARLIRVLTMCVYVRGVCRLHGARKLGVLYIRIRIQYIYQAFSLCYTKRRDTVGLSPTKTPNLRSR